MHLDSHSERQASNGKEGAHKQAAKDAEVQGSRVHPMPQVRSPAQRVPQVRPVPHLPSGNGPRWRDSWSQEGQLVGEETTYDNDRPHR